ncbi:hypothetical protein D3C73_278180 [compost metagenome]
MAQAQRIENVVYTYAKTRYKTITGQAIYIQERFDGLKRYKVKSRTLVLIPKGKRHKTAFVPSFRDLDPLENEQLFKQFPERFSGNITACHRQYMIDNGQTWDERPAIV